MRTFKVIAALVVAGFLGVQGTAAQQARACSAGKLIGLDTRTQTVEGTRTEHYEEKTKSNGKKIIDGFSYGSTQTVVTYVLTVEVGDMIYTAEHVKALVFGYNPTDMIVNDPVRVCIEKNKLIFIRPNGKEYKTTIARVERVQRAGVSKDDSAAGAVAPD